MEKEDDWLRIGAAVIRELERLADVVEKQEERITTLRIRQAVMGAYITGAAGILSLIISLYS